MTSTIVDDIDDYTEDVLEPEREHPLGQRLGAEFVGTFILVFLGLGLAVYGGILFNADQVAEALAWGVALMAAMAMFVYVSGGHFNPALTLGAAITGRLSWSAVLPYWLAQVAGGVGASALLFITTPVELPTQLQLTTVRSLFAQSASGFDANSTFARASSGAISTTMLQVLIIEVVATALFVAVALAVTRTASSRRGYSAAIVTGLFYGILSVATTFVAGGAMNPARATAIAVFSDSWALGQVWLFWVAPLLGAAITALLFTVFAPEPLPVVAYEDEDYDDDDDDEPDDDEDDDDTDDEAGHGAASVTLDESDDPDRISWAEVDEDEAADEVSATEDDVTGKGDVSDEDGGSARPEDGTTRA
ncbi:MIP family channel protein [Occultella glacieicola]|uniref:MIP family channel protein n=1 Tax=Occultella glacieicola TaxID=2518684 RepID=A0ABY2E7P1_9MICO|nr:aquaporin [Occultella glacieicola]TDE97577.1 MIP family channel protein [Occultella glacieicola]